jgi:CRISPR-associated protein Csx3
MNTYKISIDGNVMNVGFGDPASNDQIVKDAADALISLKNDGVLAGGPIIKINGAASMPVAVALTHGVAHLYGAVAVWDPKLKKYVVSVTHDPAYAVGDLID